MRELFLAHLSLVCILFWGANLEENVYLLLRMAKIDLTSGFCHFVNLKLKILFMNLTPEFSLNKDITLKEREKDKGDLQNGRKYFKSSSL